MDSIMKPEQSLDITTNCCITELNLQCEAFGLVFQTNTLLIIKLNNMQSKFICFREYSPSSWVMIFPSKTALFFDWFCKVFLVLYKANSPSCHCPHHCQVVWFNGWEMLSQVCCIRRRFFNKDCVIVRAIQLFFLFDLQKFTRAHAKADAKVESCLTFCRVGTSSVRVLGARDKYHLTLGWRHHLA